MTGLRYLQYPTASKYSIIVLCQYVVWKIVDNSSNVMLMDRKFAMNITYTVNIGLQAHACAYQY